MPFRILSPPYFHLYFHSLSESLLFHKIVLPVHFSDTHLTLKMFFFPSRNPVTVCRFRMTVPCHKQKFLLCSCRLSLQTPLSFLMFPLRKHKFLCFHFTQFRKVFNYKLKKAVKKISLSPTELSCTKLTPPIG